jgi:hypothetical protein
VACSARDRTTIHNALRRPAALDHLAGREHASGSQQEPGYLQRAANGHLVSRAIRHGVFPRFLREVELPSNMSVSWAESPSGEDDHRAR